MSRLRAGDGQSTTCHHQHLKDRRVCPAKCQRYRVVCSHDGVWGWQPCLLTGIAVTAPVSRHCCGVTTVAGARHWLWSLCAALVGGISHQPGRGKASRILCDHIRNCWGECSWLAGNLYCLAGQPSVPCRSQPSSLFSQPPTTQDVCWSPGIETKSDVWIGAWTCSSMSIFHFIVSINDWVTICIISSQKNY